MLTPEREKEIRDYAGKLYPHPHVTHELLEEIDRIRAGYRDLLQSTVEAVKYNTIAVEALQTARERLNTDESKVVARDGGKIFATFEIVEEALSKLRGEKTVDSPRNNFFTVVRALEEILAINPWGTTNCFMLLETLKNALKEKLEGNADT